MGIFSRHPKVPEPTVTRTLTPNNGPYRSGSQVSGSITLSSSVQRPISQIQAIFCGHCVTHAYRTEHSGTGDDRKSKTIEYHDDAPLLRFDQTLCEHITALPGHMFTFPFGFTFPHTTQALRPEVYEKETAQSGAYDVGPHALPPSLEGKYGYCTYAHVIYSVEAHVWFEDQGGQEPLIVQFTPLEFVPFPPPLPGGLQPPFREYVRETDKYSSSRLVGEEKSFRHSFRDKFSRQTPSVEVTMKASLVPLAYTGTAFSFFICVELDNISDPQAISVPAVTIRVKSLHLHPVTRHRALLDPREGYNLHKEIERMQDEKVFLNAVPEVQTIDQQPSPEKKGQLVFPAAFKARIPGDVASSFRTVTINRSFYLKAVVEADIVGKEFTHKFEAGSLVVLPAMESRWTGADSRDTAAGSSAVQALPPAYGPPQQGGSTWDDGVAEPVRKW